MTSALIIIGFLMLNSIIIKDKISTKFLKLSIVFITGLLPVCFFVVYSFALQKGGALYYGTHDGFWVQSVTTIMQGLFDNQTHLLRLMIFIYFVFIVIMLTKYISKHFSFKIFKHEVLIFPLLLIGNIIAVLLLDLLFNVNFPEDRSGFQFYYFFIGSVFFLIDKIAEEYKYRILAWIVIPFVLIPVHFVYASNLTHIAVYKNDRVPVRFYETIKEKSETMPEIATIGSYRGRTMVMAYQNYLNNGNVAKNHDTDYPSLIPDFQVVKTEEFAIWYLYYHAIDYDKVSGYYLLERTNKLQRHTIAEFQGISTKGEINNEYFNLSEGSIDTLIQNPLFFEYEMDIESPVAPFEAWIVIGVSDSAGNTTAYEYIPLNWIKPVWNKETKHYHNGQLLTNLPASSQKYITYIWNLNKVPFTITNAKVTIKQLEKVKDFF